MSIRSQLIGKTVDERSSLKAKELVGVNFGEFSSDTYSNRVLVWGVQEIPGGVEVLVQAWKGNKQLGFGKDGDVDIERIRIFNPPLYVDDVFGDMVLTSVNEKTGEVVHRRLREDPAAALMEVLSHSVTLIGKTDTVVKKGKVGNTTSTFFPAVDGRTQRASAGEVWATAIAGAGTTFSDTDTNRNVVGFGCTSTLDNYDTILHAWRKYDTSALPDTDSISAVTESCYVATKDSTLGGSIAHVGGTVASTTNLAATDHLNYVGGTKYATDWTYAGLTTGAYNDAAWNASGIAAVSKTGYTTVCNVTDAEITGVQPSWSSLQSSLMEIRLVEFAGTSSDPKLTVVHAAAAAAAQNFYTLLDVGC